MTALVVGVVFDMVDNGSAGSPDGTSAVAEWGSRHATARSTDVLDTLTDLGGTRYLIVIVVVGGHRRLRPPPQSQTCVLFLLVVLVGVVTINNGLKLLIDRERPDVVHLVGTSGSSFPSGHSAAAAASWFALALVISRHWPRAPAGRWRPRLAAVITVSVCTSRALLGVHWLTDVVAGVDGRAGAGSC